MKLIEFIFTSFWSFIGTLILLNTILNFLILAINRFFRHWNIRKHGYPPPYCDADGDYIPPTKIENN